VREGKIGVPLSARDTLPYTHYLPGRKGWFFDPKLAAGGALWANGVHQIDRLRWVLDTTEAEVFGTLLAPSDHPSIEHTAVWTTRYASGCVAQSFCGGMSTKGVFSGVEVFGSEGVLRQETFGRLFLERDGETEEVLLQPPEGGHIGVEMRAFVEAVLSGGDPPIPGEWGTAVIRVAEAVVRSSREGRPERMMAT
jgi:predicted dehydrogenase